MNQSSQLPKNQPKETMKDRNTIAAKAAERYLCSKQCDETLRASYLWAMQQATENTMSTKTAEERAREKVEWWGANRHVSVREAILAAIRETEQAKDEQWKSNLKFVVKQSQKEYDATTARAEKAEAEAHDDTIGRTGSANLPTGTSPAQAGAVPDAALMELWRATVDPKQVSFAEFKHNYQNQSRVPHNPDNLTTEQVQTGAEAMEKPDWIDDPNWSKRSARLLDEDEGETWDGNTKIRHTEFWFFDGSWTTPSGYDWCWNVGTLRTKLTRAELRIKRGIAAENKLQIRSSEPDSGNENNLHEMCDSERGGGILRGQTSGDGDHIGMSQMRDQSEKGKGRIISIGKVESDQVVAQIPRIEPRKGATENKEVLSHFGMEEDKTPDQRQGEIKGVECYTKRNDKKSEEVSDLQQSIGIARTPPGLQQAAGSGMDVLSVPRNKASQGNTVIISPNPKPLPASESPTPETDANMWSETGTAAGNCVTADFARTLESRAKESEAESAALRDQVAKLTAERDDHRMWRDKNNAECDRLVSQLTQAQAEGAAMRETLLVARAATSFTHIRLAIDTALSSTSGTDFLTRLKAKDEALCAAKALVEHITCVGKGREFYPSNLDGSPNETFIKAQALVRTIDSSMGGKP